MAKSPSPSRQAPLGRPGEAGTACFAGEATSAAVRGCEAFCSRPAWRLRISCAISCGVGGATSCCQLKAAAGGGGGCERGVSSEVVALYSQRRRSGVCPEADSHPPVRCPAQGLGRAGRTGRMRGALRAGSIPDASLRSLGPRSGRAPWASCLGEPVPLPCSILPLQFAPSSRRAREAVKTRPRTSEMATPPWGTSAWT